MKTLELWFHIMERGNSFYFFILLLPDFPGK